MPRAACDAYECRTATYSISFITTLKKKSIDLSYVANNEINIFFRGSNTRLPLTRGVRLPLAVALT